MQKFNLFLDQDVSTPVMRALAKYLKSHGYEVPKDVEGGGVLVVEGIEDQEVLEKVLQNYIGSASVQEIKAG